MHHFGLSRGGFLGYALARILLTSAWLTILPGAVLRADEGPNLLPADLLDKGKDSYNPWAGVDEKGRIHGIEGQQLVVNDDGRTRASKLGPGIAVGDLNGDGLPDIVMADTFGYFWYFQNSGTATAPKFTTGEILPIWVGEPRSEGHSEGVDNVAPRIQLVDFDHDGKLDIMVGTYAGKLFFFRNEGTSSQPKFSTPRNQKDILIDTRSKGTLWCNYLSPFFLDWSHNGVLDLTMGEGTYSANSIYFLPNQGSNAEPKFSEAKTMKIIPGMGREHLTPVVVDWNNDGKLDVLAGDRLGHVNVFLNTSTDSANPTFDEGTNLKIGGRESFGSLVTLALQDFRGNKLPNLLLGTADGTLYTAYNIGKLGAPQFNSLDSLKAGPNPYPNVRYPDYWKKDQAYGDAYELLTLTNPTVEPGLDMPQGSTSKNALKFGVYPIKTNWIAERYLDPSEDELNEHIIGGVDKLFTMEAKKNYQLRFNLRVIGPVRNFRLEITGRMNAKETANTWTDLKHTVNLSATTAWTQISEDFSLDTNLKPADWQPFEANITFRFSGQPTIYITDMEVREQK